MTRNPQPATGDPSSPPDVGVLSQWQLTKLRFSKHGLAVSSLFILGVLYLMALLAEFVAPHDPNAHHLDFIYASPQVPTWSFQNGWEAPRIIQQTDPINLKTYYLKDPESPVPLTFFPRAEPGTRLFGLIPLPVKFFGVATGQLEKQGLAPETASFFFLGTDQFGRDLFSRLVHGARVSLSIGLVSIIATFFLGVIIGGISGYVSGTVDNLIQRFIEIVNAFPQLPLWLALAAIMPGEWSSLQVYFAVTIVLSLLNWTSLARVVRGKILSLREEDYALAAKLLGANHQRILFRHLVPGFTSHMIVVLTLSVPIMILGETALSFLGLGLRAPVISWGVMLQECLHLQVVANYPWLLTPVITILLTVLAFNFLGDGMRDAADPYSGR